jgi:hypothetical protein
MLITEKYVRSVVRQELLKILKEAELPPIPKQQYLSPEEQFFGSTKAAGLESDKVQQVRAQGAKYADTMKEIVPIQTQTDIAKAIKYYQSLPPQRMINMVIAHVYHNFSFYMFVQKDKRLLSLFKDFVDDVMEQVSGAQIKEQAVKEEELTFYNTNEYKRYTIPLQILRPSLVEFAKLIGSVPNARDMITKQKYFLAIKNYVGSFK